MKKLLILLALASLVAATPAFAATYKFGAHSKFTNISFESKMAVEDILGTTRTVKGHLTWAKGAGDFSIEVPVASLKTGITMRDSHLQSPTWLDAKKFPTITFKGKKAKKAGKNKYKITGDFTLHGVTKSRTISVTVNEIPKKLATKAGLKGGSWIRVRATFTVKLSDHGVKIPAMTAAKVNNSWTIKVSLFAVAK